MDLDELRLALADIDRTLLTIVARRQHVASEIGKHKRERALPTRDYRQEKEVIQRSRVAADELDIPPELAEELMKLLISSSLTVQEQDRVASHGPISYIFLHLKSSAQFERILLKNMVTPGPNLKTLSQMVRFS